MKKLFAGVLALAIVFSLSVTGLAGGHLEDGEYYGYSEADSRGYVEAKVTIEGHEIVAVELDEYQAEAGEAKGADYGWDEWHEAMDVLPDRFVAANDSEVEVVSGATGTSNQAMAAVDMALEKAAGVTEFDGTYMGISDTSDRGNHSIAWVTVEDGEIVEVDLKESDSGEYKGDGYGYQEFHEAKAVMAIRMERNNTNEVDTYTGATGSAERWIQAAERALTKAGL